MRYPTYIRQTTAELHADPNDRDDPPPAECDPYTGARNPYAPYEDADPFRSPARATRRP